ncbi:unnamed protein product [Parascedosporium putredinis]|uniref:TAFII28-like protein domain-containing protein n=1 Tax=Parascedosporium putredinis TaxID=1442378 RepID=A0A9P1M6N9_9PEZI|nr:unnamed protein product [Parascedosporium putredinis]CAI7987341.1 unnamed protein product [Parascedosporium putredinis]
MFIDSLPGSGRSAISAVSYRIPDGSLRSRPRRPSSYRPRRAKVDQTPSSRYQPIVVNERAKRPTLHPLEPPFHKREHDQLRRDGVPAKLYVALPHRDVPAVPEPLDPRPKKRTAGDMPNTPTLKHQLPPESFDDDARSQRRSPSKKRGRKKKDAAAADAASSKEATPSLVGGKGGAAAAAGEDKEEEVDEDANDMHLQDSVTSEEQRKEETRLRALLSQALDKNQYARFEAWRLTRIPEAGVRRIINATVSQSVPQNAVLVTKLIAKIYIGDIIEIARQVQEDGDLPPRAPCPATTGAPLRPEHLQEALRRYKAAGEGGHVGQLGLWHNQQNTGAERYSTRNSRKIFK